MDPSHGKRRVLHSLESAERDRCVDIFMRPDGSFGFEAYRKDGEDGRGWYAIGGFEGVRYTSRLEAVAAARANVGWVDWDRHREELQNS
ncbi:MAG: hypothetical protein KDJ36_04825 [Hyphomicrobiaceae bacterium]|nr:hypothetical protein [Hyphomicrobiaceae bacterium]